MNINALKNYTDDIFSYTDIIIEHISVGWNQNKTAFIVKWNKMRLSSPCEI